MNDRDAAHGTDDATQGAGTGPAAVPLRDIVAAPVPAWRHRVLGTDLADLAARQDSGDPDAARLEAMIVGAGCFWGVEKLLWNVPGVVHTAPGYAGGTMEDPDYYTVCSGRTGHAEVVLAVFDPARVTYRDLLRLVLENHDPTQGNRQGNDIGAQYRSAIYPVDDAQAAVARELLDAYAPRLADAGYGRVTTELAPLAGLPTARFHVAEEPHRQYLDANPFGYCPVHATGVACG
ncbi:peptide-methionine (S)-S-oxide reductase MsrA [Corynebacterium sp. 335C]